MQPRLIGLITPPQCLICLLADQLDPLGACFRRFLINRWDQRRATSNFFLSCLSNLLHNTHSFPRRPLADETGFGCAGKISIGSENNELKMMEDHHHHLIFPAKSLIIRRAFEKKKFGAREKFHVYPYRKLKKER